jgi:hypothetical protein
MRVKRWFWGIGGVLGILLAAAWIWAFLDLDQGPVSRPGDLSVEARCGVAAGRALSSAELSITCGLDEAGIEAVIARTVSRFDLQELANQVRADRLANPAALEALAMELGLTQEALVTLLRELEKASPNKPVTPESFAATLFKQDETGIALDVVSIVTPRKKPSIREHNTKSGSLTFEQDKVLEEAMRLQVVCGAVAGEEITLGRADITCGPESEDIESIVRRVVAEADITGLVSDLRLGRFNQLARVDSLAAELHLSRTTALSLIRRLAAADIPPDQLADALAAIFTQHTVLVHRIGELPDNEPTAARVRKEAAAAVAAGRYGTAKILLDLWAQSLQTDAPKQKPDYESTPVQRADQGKAFASPDRVALDVPPNVNAGELLVFTWQGPKAPRDLIFIAKPDMAENQYFLSNRNRHQAEQGSPAQLVAPAEPGRYEVRYYSFNNGKVLKREMR